MKASSIYVSAILIVIVCVSTQALVNDNCTKRDAHKLIQQWNAVFSHQTSDATEFFIGYLVFAPLYYGDAGVYNMLKRVGARGMQSPMFEAHLMRVFNTLGVLVNSLENDELVEALVAHLRSQHQARPGMKQEYMHKFMMILKDTLPIISDNFDEDVFLNCLMPVSMEIAAPVDNNLNSA